MNQYFQEALANFTREAAYGGAIRHLADLGLTARQITEQLDFPVSYEKVRQAVWEHLTAAEVILYDEPGKGDLREEAVFVKEYDRYGKATFRRVVKKREDFAPILWRERTLCIVQGSQAQEALAVLASKLEENGEECSYLSCDFGLTAKKEPARYEALLQSLGEREREYVSGLPWEGRRVYHRMTAPMAAVFRQLCETGQYQGECFFLKTADRVRIEEA